MAEYAAGGTSGADAGGADAGGADAGGADASGADRPIIPGILAVFDLDHTIIDHLDPPFTSDRIQSKLNSRILYILMRLGRIRASYPFIDIILLTNNSNVSFIAAVDAELLRISQSQDIDLQRRQFFNYIMDRTDPSRTDSLAGAKRDRSGVAKGVEFDPPKSMVNIQTMITRMYKFPNMETLQAYLDPARIFFVDDRDDHVLTRELGTAGYPNHFVHITPPFRSETRDLTNLDILDAAIALIERVHAAPAAPGSVSEGEETESASEVNLLTSAEESVAEGSVTEGSVAGVSNSENETGRENPVFKQVTKIPPTPVPSPVLLSANNVGFKPAGGGGWKHKTAKKRRTPRKQQNRRRKTAAKKNLRSKYRK